MRRIRLRSGTCAERAGEPQWVSDHVVWAPQKFAEFVGMRVEGCRLLDFFDDVSVVGRRAVKVDLNHVVDDLSLVSANYRLSELMLTGCTMMLAP